MKNSGYLCGVWRAAPFQGGRSEFSFRLPGTSIRTQEVEKQKLRSFLPMQNRTNGSERPPVHWRQSADPEGGESTEPVGGGRGGTRQRSGGDGGDRWQVKIKSGPSSLSTKCNLETHRLLSPSARRWTANLNRHGSKRRGRYGRWGNTSSSS